MKIKALAFFIALASMTLSARADRAEVWSFQCRFDYEFLFDVSDKINKAIDFTFLEMNADTGVGKVIDFAGTQKISFVASNDALVIVQKAELGVLKVTKINLAHTLQNDTFFAEHTTNEALSLIGKQATKPPQYAGSCHKVD